MKKPLNISIISTKLTKRQKQINNGRSWLSKLLCVFIFLVIGTVFLFLMKKRDSLYPYNEIGGPFQFDQQASLNNETRPVLISQLNKKIQKKLQVKKGTRLHLGFGLSPEDDINSEENITFIASVTNENNQEIPIVRKLLNPEAKNKWYDYYFDVTPYQNQTIILDLKTESDSLSEEKGNDFKVLWQVPHFHYNQKEMKRPNIILISLDECRADRLSLYGNPRKTSPHLDQFSSLGVVFNWCIAQSPYTSPSHMSIMTSLLPSSHGLMYKDQFPLVDIRLAKILKRYGYATIGITGGGYVSASRGFSEGFDQYGETWLDLKDDIEIINNQTVNWLKGHKKDLFFLFMHTYTIHSPYTHTKFLDDVKDAQNKIEDRKARYDSGIAFVDFYLGMLFKKLKDYDLLDSTIVIITSDHGTILNRPLYFFTSNGHSLLDEMVHVPLLIVYQPNLPSGLRISHQVSSIDIMPTILELAGIDWPDKIQGRSLLQMMKGKGIRGEQIAYSEALYWGPEQKAVRVNNRYKLIWIPSFDDFLIQDFPSKFKEQLIKSLEQEMLFDLKKDPTERETLIAKYVNTKNRLKGYLEKIVLKDFESRMAKGDDIMDMLMNKNFPKKLIEQLRSLGYIK